MLQRWARILQVLEIGRVGPVLEVAEIFNEAWLHEVFVDGEVVDVEGRREGLDELDRS